MRVCRQPGLFISLNGIDWAKRHQFRNSTNPREYISTQKNYLFVVHRKYTLHVNKKARYAITKCCWQVRRDIVRDRTVTDLKIQTLLSLSQWERERGKWVFHVWDRKRALSRSATSEPVLRNCEQRSVSVHILQSHEHAIYTSVCTFSFYVDFLRKNFNFSFSDMAMP